MQVRGGGFLHRIGQYIFPRLYVGGSANLVADLSEDDLRALFQPFGSSLWCLG